MPLFLHHGPASPQKREACAELIRETSRQGKPFLIIVPDHAAVLAHTELLLNSTDTGVVLGERVLTWQDLILQLAKKILPRVHQTTPQLSRYLMHTLMMTRFEKIAKLSPDSFNLAEDLVRLANDIKSCGVALEIARQNLARLLPGDEIFDLLNAYTHELNELHYYDSGDLTTIVINALKENKLAITENAAPLTLIFSQLYPLGPGAREFLRALKKNHPHFATHIFYDDDFSQSERGLESAYLDLGDIADEKTHYENKSDLKLFAFKSPYHETSAAAKAIAQLIGTGTHASDITVITPNTRYATLIADNLKDKRVLATVFPSTKNIVPPNTDLTDFLKELGNVKNFAAAYRELGNRFAAEHLVLTSDVADVLNDFQFHDNLLSALTAKLNPKNKSDFVKRLIEETTPGTHTGIAGVEIRTIAMLKGAPFKKAVLFLGLAREFINVPGHTSFFDEYLGTNAAFYELAKTARYRAHVANHRVRQALLATQSPWLSVSETDFDGKPLSLLDDLNATRVAIHADTNKTSEKIPAKDFFKTKKHSFSVSELQDYVDCPYKYYARHHLKLGSSEWDDFEVSADVKGSFVHRVLFRLLKENLSEYLDALEYEIYRKKISAKLGLIIDDELKKDENTKKFDTRVVDYFAWRALKAIEGLIDIEAKLKAGKKKHTSPKTFEWAFGVDNKTAFDFDFGNEKVSVKGRIDRIDVSNTYKSFTVIDYKTGTLPTSSELKNGEALQLTLYLMAVKKLLYPDYAPSAAFYYGLGETEIKGLAISSTPDAATISKRSHINVEAWTDLEKIVTEKIKHAVSAMHQGKFSPAPRTEDLCKTCDYRHVCGYKSKCFGEVAA